MVLVVPADAVEPASAHRRRRPGADVAVAGGDDPGGLGPRRAGRGAPVDAEVIVVHDGARPLASPALFRAVVDAVAGGADAAVPGVAVADTLEAGRGRCRSTATVDRDGLVAVQTPQAFRAEVLRRAHDAGADATDDAAWSRRWALPCASCPATRATSR